MILKYKDNDRWIFIDNIYKFDTEAGKVSPNKTYVQYVRVKEEPVKIELLDEAYLLNDGGKTIQKLK